MEELKKIKKEVKGKLSLCFDNITLANATQNKQINREYNNQLDIPENLVDDLLICNQAISIPLTKGKEKDSVGGLIDRASLQMIEEAIHFTAGKATQELPCFENDKVFTEQLPKIEKLTIFGGILFNHFGHFLVESLGRLWAYDSFRQFDPYIFFNLYHSWGLPDHLTKTNFINQVLSGFKIPADRLILSKQPIEFERIIIPSQRYGFGYLEQPDNIFLSFIRTFKFKHIDPPGFENADKVYVSRSKLPEAHSKIVGELLFEEYLASEGYKIFHPEEFSLYQQLTVYRKAEKIIFCDGSAAHSCILLPYLQADLAIIFRYKGSVLKNNPSFRQFCGYRKYVLWIDALKEQYQFGIHVTASLSTADWYKVSASLQRQDFVTKLFNQFYHINYLDLVKRDLAKFIRQISSNPDFIDFMINLGTVHCKE